MSYQNIQVLAALRSGPKTTFQLITSLHICSVTKRISELRRAGHPIESREKRISGKRIVTYFLLDKVS